MTAMENEEQSEGQSEENEIREQAEAAHERLGFLGYIWKMPEGLGSNGGVTAYHQLGDSSQRVLWRTWDTPQTLAVERYRFDGQWKEQARLNLADFARGASLSTFVGDVPCTLRKVAVKLGAHSGLNGGYCFRSPVDGDPEQILYAIKGHRQQRVRVIPGGSDVAALIFERKAWGKHSRWEHLHRTTASRFLEPDYRHDVAVESIPSSPPVKGDPDYVRSGSLVCRALNALRR